MDLGRAARRATRIVRARCLRRSGAFLRDGALLSLALVIGASRADAHPAPFSFLDLLIDDTGVRGSLIVHDLDAAHDLGIEPADQLLDQTVAEGSRARLQDLLGQRLHLSADGSTRLIAWTSLEVVPERFGLKLSFTLGPRPARLDIEAVMFPYDPIHQTFVNIYEQGTLRQQNILTADDPSMRFFAGTTQGRWSVVRTFVASGIEHILIGPDHVLFLIGLLLPGGTIRRLALIVTAFTVGHSLTLSLAALDIVSPPGRIIEPLIALTIVVVGTDNLFVIAGSTPGGGRGALRGSARCASAVRRVLRPHPRLRVCFGAEGIRPADRGAGLVARLFQHRCRNRPARDLSASRRRSWRWSPAPGRRSPVRLARWGSVGVILAGTYWFVDRLFGTGGGA